VPLDTFGAPTFKLLECSGQVGENWRGSSVTATLQNLPGNDLNFAKSNSKVIVNVQATGAPVTLFTGYVTPPEQEMRPGARLGATSSAKTVAKLSAQDIIEARLAKKQMMFHCSYEGWTEGAAFAHILNRAGVPSALISIDAACVNVLNRDSTTTSPDGKQRGKRKFRFSPDCEVISALDSIAKANGRRWGVNAAGVVFLAPKLAHVTWGADPQTDPTHHTLDYDSLVAEDLVDSFRSTLTVSDFRNFLLVMVGEGNDAAAKVITDTASMWTDTATNFVGDIWSRFVAFPDGSDLDAIAVALWDEIATWHHYVEWGMKDRPQIMPDHEVRMQVPTNLVADNAVFRVLSKSWQCQRDGRYSQTLQSKFVGY